MLYRDLQTYYKPTRIDQMARGHKSPTKSLSTTNFLIGPGISDNISFRFFGQYKYQLSLRNITSTEVRVLRLGGRWRCLGGVGYFVTGRTGSSAFSFSPAAPPTSVSSSSSMTLLLYLSSTASRSFSSDPQLQFTEQYQGVESRS